MVILCCIPWTIRNYVVLHSLVPLRSTLGLQLWVGNNADAHVVWLGEHHPIHDNAERDHYVQMGEIAYMAEKRKNAVRYILTHPRHEAELIGGRFVMLWSGGTPHPIDDFIHNPSLWFRYVLLFNIAAGVRGARRNRDSLPKRTASTRSPWPRARSFFRSPTTSRWRCLVIAIPSTRH